MTQEAQLKACPFCGGEAQMWTPQDAFEVFCRSCGCGTSLQETREAAIAAWNTRTPDSVIAELVSCVRDCVDVLGPLAKEPNVNPWLVQANALLAKLEASK